MKRTILSLRHPTSSLTWEVTPVGDPDDPRVRVVYRLHGRLKVSAVYDDLEAAYADLDLGLRDALGLSPPPPSAEEE